VVELTVVEGETQAERIAFFKVETKHFTAIEGHILKRRTRKFDQTEVAFHEGAGIKLHPCQGRTGEITKMKFTFNIFPSL
jgi:hypothetical protein